jgi:hypothetical protein
VSDKSTEAVEFATVLNEELKQIDMRRRQRKLSDAARNGDKGVDPAELATPAPEQVRKKAHDRQLVGLAFSGGGIRSATFNLGFLQGLAGMGLLRIFDYLSTVSGGGYIGAWLAAWMHRHPGKAAAVENALRPEQVRQSADEGQLDPIRHLRRHTNYLAPRQGFLSADRWVLWSIYLRNFLLNQLMLLPAAFAVLLLPRLVMFFYCWPFFPQWGTQGWEYGAAPDPVPLESWRLIAVALAFAVLAGIGLTNAFRAARAVRTKSEWATAGRQAPRSPRWLLTWAVLPLVLAAIVFCYLGPYRFPLLASLADGPLDDFPGPKSEAVWSLPWWCVDLFACMIVGGLVVVVSYVCAGGGGAKPGAKALLSCFGTGLALGLLLFGVYMLLSTFFDWDGSHSLMYVEIAGAALVTAVGPACVLLTIVCGIAFAVGMLRDDLPEELREWWGSLAAQLLMIAVAWVAIHLIALYAIAFVLWAGPWLQGALGSGWVLTVASGVLAGSSNRTGGLRSKPFFLDRLARFSLYVFVAGIFVLVSLLVHVALDNPPKLLSSDEVDWPYQDQPQHPPTRVTVTRTGEQGEVTVARKKEHLRIPDEGAAARQQYWLGMLNTRADGAEGTPQPSLFWLGNADVNSLEKSGIAREKLEALRPRNEWDADQFRRGLDHLLPKKISRQTKEMIVAAAQAKGSVDSAKKTFHFKLAFLEETDLPESLRGKLEPLEYRVRRYEELEDEVDRLFPDAWNEQIRRQILQRIIGTGAKVDFEPLKFLGKIGLWLAICVSLLLLAAWRIDVNAFSLQGVYKNRLVRAYLGASRGTDRIADPVQGLDPDDDLPLAELGDPKAYDGPYLVANTAMNLVRGKELAWQERMAESFTLTPLYCGSQTTGYRPTLTGRRAYAGGLTLGTAVAISGAAASPNMGYHSSPAITFLLTVFNARLGVWLGNPKVDRRWRDAGPRYGFFHLFKELFGWTDESSNYVYLSDGGHFENLGAYELVKRRCRYIVICDAGQDEAHDFQDLGNLIRKVRIDQGIRIELAPDCLRLQTDPRHSRWHCAVGKIRYDDVDDETAPGTLIYIKPSLTGDEPADVLHYAASHPTFPHESTSDQFFTESQFESYRALGQHVARAVFEQSKDEADEQKADGAEGCGQGHLRWCRELFAALDRRWFAMPPEYEAKFVESTHGFIDVQEDLRNDPRLGRLTLDLYPELDPAGAALQARETADAQAARRSAELHVLAQMLQVMENAYLSLNLEANYSHPLNRGWMEVFHRWTGAPTFHGHWPHLRGEFNRAFVRFCERQMRLGVVTGTPLRLGPGQPSRHLDRLLLEFRTEWTEHSTEVEQWLAKAEIGEDALAWAIYPTREPPGRDAQATEGVPAGIILVWPAEDDHKQTPPLKVYQLFVWMRGAYRNTGLGRPAVGNVLGQLTDSAKLPDPLPRPFRLLVRLPAADLTGPGGKLQRAMWLTFFYQLEFVRVRDSAMTAQDEIKLELQRDFPGV